MNENIDPEIIIPIMGAHRMPTMDETRQIQGLVANKMVDFGITALPNMPLYSLKLKVIINKGLKEDRDDYAG